MSIEKGYYKVLQEGGNYVIATFYNPNTKETITKCVRDYDYSDCSRDDDELYFMEINKDIQRIYYHDKGMILEGDKARVIKGRTLKHGYIGTVQKIKEYKDKYGRWLADYIYFEDGKKINIKNCELVME